MFTAKSQYDSLLLYISRDHYKIYRKCIHITQWEKNTAAATEAYRIWPEVVYLDTFRLQLNDYLEFSNITPFNMLLFAYYTIIAVIFRHKVCLYGTMKIPLFWVTRLVIRKNGEILI